MTTTARLLGKRPRRTSPWTATLSFVADRLVEAYGVPDLGNFRDPVKEIFYILLSNVQRIAERMGTITIGLKHYQAQRGLTVRIDYFRDCTATEKRHTLWTD